MDWRQIKTEYITGNISLRDLADKHGISYSTLSKTAWKEDWNETRNQKWNELESKTLEKTIEKESTKAANSIELFNTACDLLLNRAIQLASNELSSQEMRQLSATLKDLRELKGIKSDADMREQEARIKKLEQEVCEQKDTTVIVRFDDDMNQWNR